MTRTVIKKKKKEKKPKSHRSIHRFIDSSIFQMLYTPRLANSIFRATQ